MPLGLHCPCVFALLCLSTWINHGIGDCALCPSVGGCSPWRCLQGKALQAPVFFGGCPQLQEHSATSLPPLVAFELHGARETLAGAGAG